MTQKELLDLKNQRKVHLDAMNKAFTARKAATDDAGRKTTQDTFNIEKAAVAQLNADIEDAEAVLAEEGRFDETDSVMLGKAAKQENDAQEAGIRRQLDAVRGDNGYMKAFQKALVTHQSVDSSRGVEDFNILHKALSIGGGTTPGEDGGFLVPVDFDGLIIQETKDFVDLSALFNVEKVNTNTGWRAVEVAGQRTKLPEIAEMGTIGKEDQPKFKKVSYTLRQFGDRLPISNPLLQDVGGLMSYIASWFGPKLVLTKNDLLLTILKSLTFAPQTASTDAAKVKAIKSIFNKSLNTAHSRGASLLTNQNVYDEMDGWVDGQGRAMLVPDISGDFSRFKGRPVTYADNDEIGTITAETKTYDPLFIGNFKALGTLFDRGVLEMAASNIGGDAWATNSTEVRVICRMDAQDVDKTAVVATGYERQ